MSATAARPLHRILGLGFGLAIAFGTTVGVGVLRMPGSVAAVVGDPATSMACWAIGGAYTMLAALSIAELAALFPEAGGFRVYSREAFGGRASFAVGWIDWLANVSALAYSAVTLPAFLGAAWPALARHESACGVAAIAVMALAHVAGLRIGRSLATGLASLVGLMLLALVAACFLHAPAAQPAAAAAAAAARATPGLLLAAALPAVQLVITAYDGWYAPIYLAEENVDAGRTLPRSIIGGAFLSVGFVLLLNLALLRVLPVPELAAAPLPPSAAAARLLPSAGPQAVMVLALLTIASIVNSTTLTSTRILFSIARDGWLPRSLASVNAGGTPVPALLLSAATAMLLVLTGTFAQIVSLFAVLILLYYSSAFLAVLVLRVRRPGAHRPFRVPGYPVTPLVVLLGSAAFLVATLRQDARAGWVAVLFLAASVPAHAWAARRRQAGN